MVAPRQMRAHHDTVGAVRNRVTNVADLSPGRAGVLDHGLEHLGSANDGLAGNVAHGDDLLLRSKDLGRGNLDTQVATGNHDTVRLLENLGEVVEALAVLNLGDDLNVSAVLAENLADVLDILSTTDKSCLTVSIVKGVIEMRPKTDRQRPCRPCSRHRTGDPPCPSLTKPGDRRRCWAG